MSEPKRAIFLSYASEDAQAVQHIAEALRAAGIEVWFDRDELRGGDAWDRRIRDQIHDCRLFVPVISAQTEAREEGYFRREWKLAVDRTHDMAESRTFLVPVVIDDTSERGASVPEKFRELQWTRLPEGETSPAFVERVRRLLQGESTSARTAAVADRFGSAAGHTASRPAHVSRARAVGWRLAGAALAVALGYLAVNRLWIAKRAGATSTAAPASTFAPPPHSVAVLPFVNMSGDKDQDYFSDGLSEELLNDLARINALQVAARTSAFSFKGKNADISTIAHQLNVGAVLEGSVRRSGNTIRITAQLINAMTGFHIWSETYDRDLGDMLKLQTDIATAVASALKATLLGDEAAKIEAGGTHSPAALDAYLRASRIYWTQKSPGDAQAAIDGYTGAIRLDPEYALAYAARAQAYESVIQNWASSLAVIHHAQDTAEIDARKAIALAPDLSEGHLALAVVNENRLAFTTASEEFSRALALGPGNARVLRDSGAFAVVMGRSDGLTSVRRALVLDPLNLNSYTYLAGSLLEMRKYDEAIATLRRGLALTPEASSPISAFVGLTYYLQGDLHAAVSNCQMKAADDPDSQICLAMAYDKLGRHADAEAMLTKARAGVGDARAATYSAVYAQWGNASAALRWLETAVRLRDPELQRLKTGSLWDPVRAEPRFQAVVRELKFPE